MKGAAGKGRRKLGRHKGQGKEKGTDMNDVLKGMQGGTMTKDILTC